MDEIVHLSVSGSGGRYVLRWHLPDEMSTWRRISVGMWGKPSDPQIYGHDTLPVEKLLAYLRDVEEATGVDVTITTFFIKAVSRIFERYPDLNVMVIGSKVYQRENNDIFCLVAMEGDQPSRSDLSGVKLSNVDEMTLIDVASALQNKARKLRSGQDTEMEKTKSLVDYVPSSLISTAVSIIDFLTYTIPYDLDFMGIRSDPFGSAMVTSVGQFGIRQGFAPLVPASHCPMILLPGEVHETTFAEDGEAVVKRGITLSCTFDHRCFDGYQVGKMVQYFQDLLLEPREHFPSPEEYSS